MNFRKNFKKYWPVFLILLITTIIIWLVLYKNIQVPLIADFCTILALLGVAFVFWQYFQGKKQDKKQALLALKNQLNVVCEWASCKDNAYVQANKEEYRKMMTFKWCNPFHVVYHTETTAIETIWSFSGMCLLSDKIIERVANLNQCIENFNSYLNKINAFSDSINPSVAIKIKEVLDKRMNPFEECSHLEDEERNICKRLYDMYTYLHFNLIGDDSFNGLHKQCKELIVIINEEIELID